MSPVVLGAIAALAWGTHDFGARFAGLRIGVLTTLLSVTLAGFAGMSVLLYLTGESFPVPTFDGLWLVALMGAQNPQVYFTISHRFSKEILCRDLAI